MGPTIKLFNESNKKYMSRKKILLTLEKILKDANYKDPRINIIFTTDAVMRDLNYRYLNNDYETDVISFCLEEDPLEGEVYISVGTALKNSLEYNTTCTQELTRYAIHGVLHLIGYNDKTKKEKEIMTEKEDMYLEYMEGLGNATNKNGKNS